MGKRNFREAVIICAFWLVLPNHRQDFLGVLARAGSTSYCNKEPFRFNNKNKKLMGGSKSNSKRDVYCNQCLH